MNDFSDNESKYTELVENAVRFSGFQINFFLQSKALIFSELATAHFGAKRKVRLLDVGCGIGLLHPLLNAQQFLITGVDVVEGALRVASSQNPNAIYKLYDGSRLPFNDSEFDMVIAVCVIHHIQPKFRDSFLSEMRRVTRKGGLICIIEHNPINPLTRLAVMRCPFDRDAILLFSREVRKGLENTGLKNTCTRFFLLLPSTNKILRKIEKKLSWLHLGAQYCVSVIV